MAFLDDLQRLSDLRSSGHLTDAEFAAAKQRLLSSEQPMVKTRDAASERLLLEAELARIDREFEQERRQCLSYGRYGHTHEPSVAGRVIFPVVGLAALIVLGSYSGFGGFGGMPLGMGLLFVGALAIGFISNEMKLSRLNTAKRKRDQATAQAMRRMNELRRHS